MDQDYPGLKLAVIIITIIYHPYVFAGAFAALPLEPIELDPGKQHAASDRIKPQAPLSRRPHGGRERAATAVVATHDDDDATGQGVGTRAPLMECRPVYACRHTHTHQPLTQTHLTAIRIRNCLLVCPQVHTESQWQLTSYFNGKQRSCMGCGDATGTDAKTEPSLTAPRPSPPFCNGAGVGRGGYHACDADGAQVERHRALGSGY